MEGYFEVITTEQLFTQEFKPEWQARKERAAAWAELEEALEFNTATGAKIEAGYKRASYLARRRILSRVDEHKNYTNA